MYVTQYEWVWTIYGYRLMPVQRFVPLVYNVAPNYFAPQSYHFSTPTFGVER